MPQNIGSINDLTSKNIHWVDTKLIVLREKFAWHQHDTERNKNRVARSRTQINQGEFIDRQRNGVAVGLFFFLVLRARFAHVLADVL